MRGKCFVVVDCIFVQVHQSALVPYKFILTPYEALSASHPLILVINVMSQVYVDPSVSQVLIYPAALEGAEWKPGQIILKEGESLRGGVLFDPVLELVYLKNGDEITAFSPKGVLEFKFENERFVSLPYDEQGSGFEKDFYFRLIEENEHFLVLEKISETKVKRYSWGYLPSTSLAYLKNIKSVYLGLNHQVKIVRLGKDAKENKKSLKEIYMEDFTLINDYMKEKGWKYKHLTDIVETLRYYYTLER